jgi:hypothetical protein
MFGQLWKTVRTLGVAFLLLSGLGALMEEKGLSRGMLANPDMKPQLETTTKFADVKGVDEAKVGWGAKFMCLGLPESFASCCAAAILGTQQAVMLCCSRLLAPAHGTEVLSGCQQFS